MAPTATLLAAPLTAATPPLYDQVRSAKAAGADLVELRADLMADVPPIVQFLCQPRELPIILTIRSSADGGQCQASDAERAALYDRLAHFAPDYLDVEFAAWRRSPELRAVAARVCRAPGAADRGERPGGSAACRLILSQHDLGGTPAQLGEALQPLLAAPAAVIKAAFAARHALDACRVLTQLQRWSPQRKLVMVATEPAGLITRVLARKFNAFLTFAALTPGHESAAGQPTVRELLDVYHWRDIDSATNVFGLVGWPVAHSRSPEVHNAAMRAAAINGVYVPLPVDPTYAALADFLEYLTQNPQLDFRGLSITVPHKEHAARWLTERGFPQSEYARRAGAVNTLTRTSPNAWAGDNTDVAGFLSALAKVPGAFAGGTAAVLGAGGAARAAVCALQLCGYRVTLFNRTPERARRLAEELGCAVLPWGQRPGSAQVIVNCTSLGMFPEMEGTPLPADALPAGPAVTVIDAVYTPARTRLLREAQQCGCRTIAGTEVFLAQATAQFQIWHGRPLVVDGAW